MKKRIFGLFMFMLILTTLCMTNVLALSFEEGLNRFVNEGLGPFAELAFGGLGDHADAGELLFVKILFFIIIMSVVYYSVKQIPNLGENKGVLWTITIAVSLIAVRYFSNPEVIEFIWLPHGVLGVALAALLPFIIFFFFMESFDSSLFRKVGWSLFAVVYLMLALVRWEDLSVSGDPLMGFIVNLGWFYVIVFVLSVLAVIADKTIHSQWIKQQLEKNKQKRNTLRKLKLQDKIEEWNEVVSNENATDSEVNHAKAEIKKLQNRISELYS